ncbi:hypothetical protein [Salinicoccus roseus]|uniref:hypothetical protein n=1 Tax=Salinicoccus roseus TaxID=45670 RepID=UPI002301A2A1|nr:hypothetical protein [Salinicoccus roseus]
MERQDIKVRVYKFKTPIIYDDGVNQRRILTDYFDFERINFCLINIVRKEYINRKKTYKESETIWLDTYNPNYSDDYAIGKLYSVSHGVEAVNVDINSLIEKARLGVEEGIQGASLFLIDKQSGYLYITEDKNHICNKYNINNYFYSEKKQKKHFIKEFNEVNDKATIEGRSRFFTLQLLEPIPLIEQLRRMRSVKKIDLYPSEIQNENSNRGLLDSLKADLSDYLPSLFKAKVELSGFQEELTADVLEELIEYLSESDKYEQYKLEGVNEDNVRRVFSSDSVTRDFIIECDTTVEGWPQEEQFYDATINRISEDDQLNIRQEPLSDVINVQAEDVEIRQEGGEDDQGARTQSS